MCSREAIEASEKSYKAIRHKIEQGKSFLAAPQGTSMFPFLKAGRDQVLLNPLLPGKEPRRGDIILYRREDGLLVLHRLHHHNQNGYYFVGDNQTALEGPLHRKQLLGIAARIYRHGKSFSVHHPVYWAAGKLWLQVRPFRHRISRRVKRLLQFLHLYRD